MAILGDAEEKLSNVPVTVLTQEVLAKIVLFLVGHFGPPPALLGMLTIVYENDGDDFSAYHRFPAAARMLDAEQAAALRNWREAARELVTSIRAIRASCVSFERSVAYSQFAWPYISSECCQLRLGENSDCHTDRVVVVVGSDAGTAYGSPDICPIDVPFFKLVEVYNTHTFNMPPGFLTHRQNALHPKSLESWFTDLALLVASDGDRPWWRIASLSTSCSCESKSQSRPPPRHTLEIVYTLPPCTLPPRSTAIQSLCLCSSCVCM